MILPDTSVWIAVFRRKDPLDLEARVDLREIATCIPVIQEVLQGFDDDRAFRVARLSMTALPVVESPLSAEVFDLAVDLYRRARRASFTIRSPARPSRNRRVRIEQRPSARARTAAWRFSRANGDAASRASVDCLVAACALRNDLEVWHDDRDYDVISRISGLRVRRIRS